MKLKNIIYNIIGVAVMALSFAACDNIDEADRLVYVEPVAASRCVLVEEFSGQFCVNCPEGAATLHSIQNEYGVDSVIVVTIHAGELALKENEYPDWIGLANPIGEKLFEAVGKPSQPAAVIDRRTPALARPDWLGEIKNSLQLSSNVFLTVEKQYDSAARQLDVTIKVKSTIDYSGNLHVWLIEDGIEAFQDFPTTHDEKYVHNNIFRTSITSDPIAGDGISLDFNDEVPSEYNYSITLREDYKPENMSIVAFVDNAYGVEQTIKAKVAD